VGLKLLIYLIKRITAAIVIIFLIALAFTIGYDWANVYVILNEGLTKQASIVLNRGVIYQLSDLFTHNYIATEPLLNNNPFENFIITDYDQRIKVKWLWVWPWENTVEVTVDEEILNIHGKAEKTQGEDQDEGEMKLPQWENGEKLVVLKKNQRRWKIDKILLKEPIQQAE